MKQIIIGLINFYQIFLSFDTGLLRVFTPAGACRHEVSCSEFTKIQIKNHGIMTGIGLGVKRLVVCNPFAK